MKHRQSFCRQHFLRPTVSRRGISLLEVLIAIMVLSIGLLGLAALIPVGKFEVAQTMIVDRGATLGRLVARDLQIRGLLSPERCLYLNPGGPASQAPVSYTNIGVPGPASNSMGWLTNLGSAPLIMMPLCIDPLTIAYPPNLALPSTPHATFPYRTSNVPVMSGAPPIARCTISSYYAPVLQMAQVPLGPGGGWPSSNAGATGLFRMDYRQALRLFAASDDLTFNVPDSPYDRPNQVYMYSGSPGIQVAREAQGDFSWLVTVSPALSDFMIVGPDSSSPVVKWQGTQVPRTFNISIVIFYKRVPAVDVGLDPSANVPQERIVFADILGTGFGGGDIILRVNGVSQNVGANLLDVKPQQWIMLTGTMQATKDLVGNRVVLAWYRVVKVGDVVEDMGGSNWGRRVTLAGPDWLVYQPVTQTNPSPTNPMFVDADTSNPLPTVHAGIFEGAIAVYDRTITLDGYSLWQQ